MLTFELLARPDRMQRYETCCLFFFLRRLSRPQEEAAEDPHVPSP